MGQSRRIAQSEPIARGSASWGPSSAAPTGATEPHPRVIAGSGRSGTTWVLDALAEANRLRTVFEPLAPPFRYGGHAFANRLVTPGEPAPELVEFFSQVFRGDVSSVWTDYRVNLDRLRDDLRGFPRLDSMRGAARRTKRLAVNYLRYRRLRASPRLLVKLVRGNLLLEWLRREFDARILLLVRHPGAVVESKLRAGIDHWEPHSVLARYRDDPAVRAHLDPPVDALLDSELDLPSAHTLIWCIENELPLRGAERAGYSVIYYERLLTEPEVEWRRAADALDLPMVPAPELRRRPSEQTARHPGATGFDPSNLAAWTSRLEPRVVDDMARILATAGVSRYSMESPLPSQRAEG